MNILRLRELLKEKEMTGKELAERVGVSQNTISNIVNGYSFPKPELLLSISEKLDVDLKDLFISTKQNDLSDPSEAIKEIKRIVDRVRR